MEPTTINGIDFPKNLTIEVDVLSVHYDPDIYGPVDPNEFYPQRLTPSRFSILTLTTFYLLDFLPKIKDILRPIWDSVSDQKTA